MKWILAALFCVFSFAKAKEDLMLFRGDRKLSFVDLGGLVISSNKLDDFKLIEKKIENIKSFKTKSDSGYVLNPAAQFCDDHLGDSEIWKDNKANEYDVCKVGESLYVLSWSALDQWNKKHPKKKSLSK